MGLISDARHMADEIDKAAGRYTPNSVAEMLRRMATALDEMERGAASHGLHVDELRAELKVCDGKMQTMEHTMRFWFQRAEIMRKGLLSISRITQVGNMAPYIAKSVLDEVESGVTTRAEAGAD